MKLEKQLILDELMRQIKRRRDSVRLTGDDADKVYMGEDIGKLEVAISIIKGTDWFS